MKKLFLLLVPLFLLAFAIPALATTSVTLDIPALSQFTEPPAVSLAAVVADLNAGFVFGLNQGNMIVRTNAQPWTLTAEIPTLFSGFSVYVDDTQTVGNTTGAGFTEIVVAPTAIATLLNYGTAPDSTYALDWNFATVDWNDPVASQTRVVTWTFVP